MESSKKNLKPTIQPPAPRVKPDSGQPLGFWIDLENITCVTFFSPVIERLRELGHQVHLTYRNCPFMPELMEIYGLTGQRIGIAGGKRISWKIQKGVGRAVRLAMWSRKREIDLGIGFGARALALSCWTRGLRNTSIIDYEHVSYMALKSFCDWLFVRDVIDNAFWKTKRLNLDRLVKFPGLKEQVYVPSHRVDFKLRQRLLNADKTLIVIRPPALNAHYHDHGSEEILKRLLQRIAKDPSVVALCVPRAGDPYSAAALKIPNFIDLPWPVNGLDLVAAADLVISGGGTMIREAAALGVPAYSIFTGHTGVIDEHLTREGRLVMISDPEEVSKIAFRRRDRELASSLRTQSTLEFFITNFVEMARCGKPAR